MPHHATPRESWYWFEAMEGVQADIFSVWVRASGDSEEENDTDSVLKLIGWWSSELKRKSSALPHPLQR
jgi:hypothetical protein